MWRRSALKRVSAVNERSDLITENAPAPVVTAGSAVLAVTRPSVRDNLSARNVEPSLSAAKTGLSEPKDFNSLKALTTPLSVENVTATQGLGTIDPNEQTPLEVEKLIRPNTLLNAPLNPGDVTGRTAAAKKIGETTEEKEPEGLIEKAKAEGSKLVSKEPGELTEEERHKVEDLKRRDAEVRSHEQAHSSAGGPYAGSPRLQFTRGPDGKFYAVAGEVSIDTSAIAGNPQATIRKMQQVKRAALAPQQPSVQDRRIAAEADRKMLRARQEIRETENAEIKKSQAKQKQKEAEAQGFERSITPEQAPVFNPSSRFQSNTGGTGPARGTGLAGTGGLDVDASDTIDAGVLFGLVA
jgi:hypothetical protein